MRRRIVLTIACLVGLVMPPGTVSAAPWVTGSAQIRNNTVTRNMAVERSLLRALILQRHALLTRIVPDNVPRGHMLTVAMLAGADAVLSADLADLSRRIAALNPHMLAPRAAHIVKITPAATPVVPPAAPGALWSPDMAPLQSGPAAWTTGPTMALPSQRSASAVPLAASLSTLTSWDALLPAANARPTTPTATPSGTPADGTAMLSSANSDFALRLDDTHDIASAHGNMTVDGGSGSLSLAGVNPQVDAAALTPITGTAATTATIAAPLTPVAGPPGLAALLRRRADLLLALTRVRQLEAWARDNAPATVLTADDSVPSTDDLHLRLDHWTATIPLTVSDSLSLTAALAPPQIISHTLIMTPAVMLGATLSLSTSAGITDSTAMSDSVDSGIAVSSTVSASENRFTIGSTISDTAPTDLAASAVDAPLALASAPAGVMARAASVTGTATGTNVSAPGTAYITGTATDAATPVTVAPTVSDTATVTPTMIDTATVTPTETATIGSPTSSATITPTETPAATGTITPTGTITATEGATVTITPDATITPGVTTTPPPTGTVDISSTAVVTAQSPLPAETITATTPATAPASLDLALVGTTPALTITTGLSTTAALTMVVTLPITADRTLSPAAFLRERGALESVLRQGQALYAQLQASQAGAMASYRAHLNAIVQLNATIQNRWYAQWVAHVNYRNSYHAYLLRAAAFNAYAHRLHLATLRHQQWLQRMAAWTRYAQQLSAYHRAMAARKQQPITTPVTGTASQPLPTEPVAPPFPGPEPPPFTETPPPWPGQAPAFVPNPGPEPGGYALPQPPDAIPPWNGAAALIAAFSLNGVGVGPNAVGREETTQATLLADGALDVVGSYQDPIKGIITTYWGGQTIFQSFHTGIDIAAPEYTPIHAAAGGKVIWAGYAVPGQRHESYGLCVVIQHNARFSTLYAHMDDLSYGLQVRVGDVVQQGQVIGYVGMTGWTTGPHLHFEMRDNNIQFNPLLLIPNPQS